jgi:hypothetical protein
MPPFRVPPSPPKTCDSFGTLLMAELGPEPDSPVLGSTQRRPFSFGTVKPAIGQIEGSESGQCKGMKGCRGSQDAAAARATGAAFILAARTQRSD